MVRYGNSMVSPTMTLVLPRPTQTPSAARCDGDLSVARPGNEWHLLHEWERPRSNRAKKKKKRGKMLKKKKTGKWNRRRHSSILFGTQRRKSLFRFIQRQLLSHFFFPSLPLCPTVRVSFSFICLHREIINQAATSVGFLYTLFGDSSYQDVDSRLYAVVETPT
ncbi:hypothetical protein BO71DRAFT_251096 [Aspergillus ellipticus CBS 707.79]|uniref:Uncharacterized protein n=1 Tax=Aspergillus ellipticus CBS 707.79 TaxID=1448320 RepID=A0A319DZR6_9EURO|nr:hypothetical protein BO71DRAFT_251096 [Aspergillus ellipticus CBS 707.79]